MCGGIEEECSPLGCREGSLGGDGGTAPFRRGRGDKRLAAPPAS